MKHSDGTDARRTASSTLQGSIARSLDSDEEWSQSADVLAVLRPNLDKNQFVADRDRLTAEGYRLIAVKIDSVIVAIASYVITPHPICYREMEFRTIVSFVL